MISIKLPNFFEDNSLNGLKRKMGIDKSSYGNFGNSSTMSIKIELETRGIDIEDLSSITPLDDYTLSYNGERIILYIRDIANYGDSYNLPRFHVAHCKTLKDMAEKGRKKRYVVSQNESDLFHLHVIQGRSFQEVKRKLNVCQNCLNILNWNGFSFKYSETQRNKFVREFKISDFFIKYPKSLLESEGYSDENSPLNQYPKNWSAISYDYRQSKDWTCEQCGVNLIDYKKLLHTHHINAQKNECHYANLRALCVECHANQPMHSHMHNLTNIDEDIAKVREIRG